MGHQFVYDKLNRIKESRGYDFNIVLRRADMRVSTVSIGVIQMPRRKARQYWADAEYLVYMNHFIGKADFTTTSSEMTTITRTSKNI